MRGNSYNDGIIFQIGSTDRSQNIMTLYLIVPYFAQLICVL